jgi:2-keto-4-pentenoate hydratase/2-oxohepta-3-ene-1,7-dioic acid hydratase in catechol pathway
VDYEAELAVIIGKTAFRISREEAEGVIFGYTIINDISARDIQTQHAQWFFGKSLDGFCPMGPHIVSRDEINPANLKIQCRVNGKTRQSSNTSKLIFDIPEIISTLSQGITLFPGDIIATGTPAGIGHAMNPPQYLKSGDKVECEIEKIGILTNYF